MTNAKTLKPVVLDGQFQLGRYSYVVDSKGQVIENALPSDFGNKVWDHPYVRQSNGQIEIVTGPVSSLYQAFRRLTAINDVVSRSLEAGHYIWPLSGDAPLKSQLILAYQFSDAALDAIEDLCQLKADEVYQLVQESLPKYQSFLMKLYALDEDGELGLNQEEFANMAGHNSLLISFPNNPLEVEGTSPKQLRMIQLLMMKILKDGGSPQSNAFSDDQALLLLEELRELAQELSCSPYYFEALDDGVSMIKQEKLPGQVLGQIKDSKDWPLDIARGYQEEKHQRPWILKGFEDMESSTQIFMYDAIYKGVRIEILDEADHFLRLSVADHQEKVQQANRSGRVSYINSIIMENKHVTKFLLDEQGFQVPQGEMYFSPDKAKNEFWRFEKIPFVVKPKSTNAGIGITVFKEPTSRDSYEEAIDIAFAEDDTILVEEFVRGIEYRFHILGGKCKDVLLRIPANVVGDGVHTIEELVAIKNQHPFRGEAGRTPLVNIKIGRIEKLLLKEVGLTPESIPDDGQIVYLRENSNISTGGDSKIVGELCHDSYIRIAEEIAEVIGASICGVDMMIEDFTQASSPEKPGYHVIETNAQPGMYGHLFVSYGEGSRLTMALLDELFPELEINFEPRL